MIRAFDLTAFESAQGADRQARTQDLDRICRETGFLVLTGHGVPEGTIRGVWEAAKAFFALPPEEKAKVSAPYPGYPMAGSASSARRSRSPRARTRLPTSRRVSTAAP
jgi:isopenicillin N synthase-like dioxygenase